MLKDLNLKKIYDSETDDLINEFYVPALHNSILYKRITGYFSARTLISAARGLSDFFVNNGKYKLITGFFMSTEEFEAIKKGLTDLETIISEKCMFDSNLLFDEIQKDYLKILSFLVKENRLEIKIAILPEEKRGIFHEKIGIFEDDFGNIMSFSGSINETNSGWSSNIEEFKVFRGWENGEVDYLKRDLERFNNYWSNLSTNFNVIDLPTAVKENLVNIKDEKESIENIVNRIKKYEKIKSNKIELHPFQKEAIKRWFDNNNKGILEMATGTGKTYTALGALKQIEEKYHEYCCMIVVPYKHLIPQWGKDVESMDIKSSVIGIHGEIKDWRKILIEYLRDYRDGFINKLIIITTYDTFSGVDFINIYNKHNNNTKINVIVADEVHNFGAPKYSEGMLDKINFRLGLSATPTRWFDSEGTDKIAKYFDKTIFSFDLKQAIEEKFLTQYDYYPLFVEMSEDEFDEYNKLTHKITRLYNQKKQENFEDILKLVLIKRSKIIKNSKNKILKLVELLNELKNKEKIDHLLIYCDTINQITLVQSKLNELGIINHKFTEMEDIGERNALLTRFDCGDYQCLIATKCLDEGVNVPSTKTAIIVASSTNPREYIQRRGRVLRKYPSKTKAYIYDFTVLPPSNIDDNVVRKIEQNIIKKELLRIQNFLETADNKGNILLNLSDIMMKYNVYLDSYE